MHVLHFFPKSANNVYNISFKILIITSIFSIRKNSWSGKQSYDFVIVICQINHTQLRVLMIFTDE